MGIDGKEAKDKTPVTIQKELPNHRCCTGYELEWNLKPVHDVICSAEKKEQKCIIENKLFRATVYRYCTMRALNQISDLVKNNIDITKERNYNLI